MNRFVCQLLKATCRITACVGTGLLAVGILLLCDVPLLHLLWQLLVAVCGVVVGFVLATYGVAGLLRHRR